MRDWLKEGIDDLISTYKKDIEMIAKKDKDVEWKRDHYRYASAIAFQRILNVLESQVTETPPASLQESTRTELMILRDIVDRMVITT